ncbi:MAG: trigger factor [Candidatus Aureabacteria bacterium]|nr:trigger factor [Candidatus Auribacterota bacterium]
MSEKNAGMNIKIETIDPCKKKFRIEIPAERVSQEVQLAYERLSLTANVPGFRQGKATRKVLELHFGSGVKEDIKERLVGESFAEALKEKKVKPAINPTINIKELPLAGGEPFRYEVEVEVWPEFHLGGYSGIKAVRKKAAVKDEEVEHYIAMLLDQHAEFLPVEDRPLAAGDFALLDYSGAVEGKIFDERKGLWLEMNTGSFLPGFCDKMNGMRPEETRSFTLTLPPDVAQENLRGKEASFTVILREIKQKKPPALTDDFCRELGDYTNQDELRAAIRADLLKYAEAREHRSVVEQINNYLLEHHKVPLPQTRVSAEAASIAEKTAARLLGQGVNKEEILERKEELMAASRKEAEKNLTLSCIYDEIAKREKITVSAEEREERIRQIAVRLKREPQQIKVSLEKEGRMGALEEEIKMEKVTAFLVGRARIKESKE